MMEFSLYEQLDAESSRANFDFVARVCGNNPVMFQELVTIAFTGKPPVSFRSAAVIETICRTYPFLIIPYLDQIIAKYNSFNHDGVKRGMLKCIRTVEYTEEQMGLLFDLCIEIMRQPKEKVAARVYAMDVLLRISEIYPDIRQEIALVIEANSEYESPAWKAHARSTIKTLRK